MRPSSYFQTANPAFDHSERVQQINEFDDIAQNVLEHLTDEYYSLYETDPTEDFYVMIARYVLHIHG